MTIEALLTDLNSKFDVLITLLGNQDGQPATAVAPAAAAAPARRGRGRPAADDPKPQVAVTTQAPVQPVAVATPAHDPFDDEPAPAPVVAPAKKLEKADVRAALEEYRTRLTNANKALGDDGVTATNKATTRALAWLNEVTGHTTLATLPEDKYAIVVEKAPTAK